MRFAIGHVRAVKGTCLVGALAVLSMTSATNAEHATPTRAQGGPPFTELDLAAIVVSGETTRVDLDHGRHATLTLDNGLQRAVETIFDRYAVPHAALVAIEPTTGRVLAYVSHSESDASKDFARSATPPAASIFKIVTAAALVDAGVTADERVCYGGGARRLMVADLKDNPSRDKRCASLADAMGGSINAVFAKLADRHLSESRLAQYASAFAFGQRLPFDVRAPAGLAMIPAGRLERARTAAGFWHTHLSPLHGALMAATIANDGRMPWAAIVDHVENRSGAIVYEHEPRIFRDVIPRSTARVVGDMMTRTVTHGTSRRAFFDRKDQPFLPGVSVAGKTGTLSSSNPYRSYNWWVGYAPVDDPKIALGVLVINKPKWRIKASYVAREALRHHLL